VPPFLINLLLNYMARKKIRLQLDPRSFIVTLGGWKRFNNQQITRKEFDEKLATHFGVQLHQIRDMYGMVESNMLAIECEHRRKHVPPWCLVSVRDADDLSAYLPNGKVGVIGIIDALNRSYPGYVISEDVGTVGDDVCPCGRIGQVITFQGRLRGAELGCCAVNIERFMEMKVAG
jgi:long-chain-fatty-acid---luciferin-component ligase